LYDDEVTVYITCPDVPSPSGGVQKLYDHVDVLNRHGIQAAIVHWKAPYRAAWFSNQTPITYARVKLKRGDLLAVPEVFGDDLVRFAPGVPRVSVNQNAHYTFAGVADRDRHPYTMSPDLLGVMVISENNRALVSGLFPSLEIWRVHYGFDPAVFHNSGLARGRVLSYMPRKRSDEIDVVLRLVESALKDWEIIRIDGMRQSQVADALRRSALFLSFSQREGCPMPPTEALACGCYVMGFDGFGGREYFDPRFTTRIEDGDLVAFGEALVAWLGTYEWTSAIASRSAEASSFALEMYSLDRESEEVVAFYEHFVDLAPSRWNIPEDSIVFDLPPQRLFRWRAAASHLVADFRSVVGAAQALRQSF
jgi:hypothetical protein